MADNLKVKKNQFAAQVRIRARHLVCKIVYCNMAKNIQNRNILNKSTLAEVVLSKNSWAKSCTQTKVMATL